MPSGATSGNAPPVQVNIQNFTGEKVQQQPNSAGGVDIIVGEAVRRVEKNMASGKYRPLGVGPGMKRS